MKVVFPDPDGPSTATVSLGVSSNDSIPNRAVSYAKVISLMATTGGALSVWIGLDREGTLDCPVSLISLVRCIDMHNFRDASRILCKPSHPLDLCNACSIARF